MKKIILNEQQEKILIKEFMQQGFSLSELNSLEGLSNKRFYCEKYLGDKCGSGSGRVVFEIGDGEVLKLAATYNPVVGIQQNRQEYINYQETKEKYPQLNLLFPKVFQIADDGTWLTCERVLTFNEKDSEEILNLPYTSIDKPSLLGFIDYVEAMIQEPDLNDVSFEYLEELQYYQDIEENHPWFKLLSQYIKLEGSGETDLFGNNFGIALRNNEPCIVILDNGFDKLTECINKSINKFLHENFENEYLDKHFGISLKKYMNMSDEDKDIDRAYKYPEKFYEFLEQENMLDELTDQQREEIECACDNYDDETILEFIDDLFGEEVKQKFGQWLGGEVLGYNIPTYDVMDFTKEIHNQWLVHFSDNADAIANEGFRYATYDIDNLGYSDAGNTTNKDSEGWDFAYLASYVDDNNARKYGSEAVMFRASGIQATHYGDQEEQIMFWNKDAKDIVYIEHDVSGDSYEKNTHGDYVREWYITSRLTGQVLIDSDDIEDIIIWVENNFEQYRKHLISRKASKIKNDSLKNSEHNYRYKIK